MRVAIVVGGVVVDVHIIEDDKVISPDGRSASQTVEAPILVHGVPQGSYSYESVFSAPEGGILVQSDAAGVGWAYDGASFTAPAPTLAEAKQSAASAAQQHFNSLIAAGLMFGGVVYALDPASIAKATAAGAQAGMVGLGAAGFSWPSGFAYPSAAGLSEAMTAAQMATLANALFHYVDGCEANLGSIGRAVAASATVAAVRAIDVTAGYPAASA